MSEDAPPFEIHTFEVAAADHEVRLDVFLVGRLSEHSRSYLARQIKDGRVTVDGGAGGRVRPALRLEQGQSVRAELAPRVDLIATPEPMPLTILHEDDRVLAIDKPAGLTVHPGAGQTRGTLANALAYHFASLSQVQGPLRPGIVHRLDKDTSGVILVAKDDRAHHHLAAQFAERTVTKEYEAVVKGVMELDADIVSAPLGPDRRHPTKQSVRLDIGKAAQTYFEVVRRFDAATYVRCRPRSGRTHQIRVHLASIGHPIISDRNYGGVVRHLTVSCGRQALHARRITFRHPESGEDMTIEAPLPDDFARLVAVLDDAMDHRRTGPARR